MNTDSGFHGLKRGKYTQIRRDVRFGLLCLVCYAVPAVAQQTAPPKGAAQPGVATSAVQTRNTPQTRTVQLQKELPGDFTYQFVAKNGDVTAPTPLPAAASADSPIPLALPPSYKPEETQLQVVDTGRGNMARVPVNTTGIVPLTESSFTYVQSVSVPVQAKGKGVFGVQVGLSTQDKTYNQSLLLQASDNGIAVFRNVPLGTPLTATVTYGSHPPELQTKTLTQDHPVDGYHWPAVSVDWSDVKTTNAPVMTTVTIPGATGSAETVSGRGGSDLGANPQNIRMPANVAEPGNNIVNTIVSDVVSLAVLAGLGYGIYWAYTNGKIKGILDRLGIQTAPIAEGAAVAPNPFTAPERKPVQPITEGTADPFAVGVASNGGISGYAAPSTGPRLVATIGAYSGTIFPIQGTTVDIGRDASNPIALPLDTNTSRRHATIQAGNGQYSLVDNGSSNGTFLNGVRIASPAVLRSGDEVQIGQTRFRFEA